MRDSSDSETGVSEEKADAETLEETLSDSSFERDTQDDKSRSVEEIPRPGERDFRTSHSATEAHNQVVRAGSCWLHTSLPMSCLTQVHS